jgi:16S rRNA C967 or C1407 C5-methylase (RsmB/RsmF family)
MFRQTQALAQLIQNNYIAKIIHQPDATEYIDPPTKLPWYPDGLGWYMKAPRGVIKKNPKFAEFHKFLVGETEAGNVSRQEAVSMIPPLLLDVQPHHAVLDMCAAPGSKTAQLLEALHAKLDALTIPTGVVVANELSANRAQTLVHQMNRLQSPCLMVINHDAQYLPNLYHVQNDQNSILQYDRVLCDVPCSGDGTFRKNIKIWETWSPQGALGLHATQLKILNRGCQVLKVGGRLVYSTCSLNPLENEAIVAQILRQANGALELVDVHDALPELIRTPGLQHWTVTDKEGNPLGLDAVDVVKNVAASMFPAEDVAGFHLERW